MNTNIPYGLKPGDELSTRGFVRIAKGRNADDKIRIYKITREISDKEATGFSYEAIKLGKKKSPGRFFVKIPKLKQGVSDSEAKNYLSDIYLRFSSEYQNRDRFRDNKNVAKVEDFGMYEYQDTVNKRILMIPFVVQEFVDGETLIEYLQSHHRRAGGAPAIETENAFFPVAKEIVRAVKRIHNQQVIHGDIRPKNIRVQIKKGKPVFRLVGFTRSFMLDQAFHTSSGTLPPHRYRAPECVRSNEFWYTPADIYSLGGLLFYLATGEEPPEANSNLTEFKQTILERIKEGNERLYKQNEGIVKIIDKCLRYDPEERYPYAESIYSALQSFDYSYQQARADISSLKSSLNTIQEKSIKIFKRKSEFFADIVLQRLSLLQEEIEGIQNDHYEIYGDREDIIDSLVRYLSVLKKGDQYLTVTKPAFWAPQNLGVNGRFLTMNKVMATKGVIVRRVFLLTEDEVRPKKDVKHDRETLQILEAHKEATRDMEKVHQMEVDNFNIPEIPLPKGENPRNSFYTGFRILAREEIEKYEKEVSHVALWRKTNGDQMSIHFISRPTMQNLTPKTTQHPQKGDRIVKVRFWKSEKQDRFLKEIQQQLSNSRPIKELWERRK